LELTGELESYCWEASLQHKVAEPRATATKQQHTASPCIHHTASVYKKIKAAKENVQEQVAYNTRSPPHELDPMDRQLWETFAVGISNGMQLHMLSQPYPSASDNPIQQCKIKSQISRNRHGMEYQQHAFYITFPAVSAPKMVPAVVIVMQKPCIRCRRWM
jgi:hypothetical protein